VGEKAESLTHRERVTPNPEVGRSEADLSFLICPASGLPTTGLGPESALGARSARWWHRAERSHNGDGTIYREENLTMIIVRNSFIAKPGQAGKLAAQLKDMANAGNLRNFRVMTDITGEFNHVIMEHQVESASEFEDLMTRYASDPQAREKAKGYTDLWTTGRRELFRVI
jgi:hypothetical protein